MSKPCKISNWRCLYHACMTDDCQKDEVLKNRITTWGAGKCETEQQDSEQIPESIKKTMMTVEEYYGLEESNGVTACEACGHQNEEICNDCQALGLCTTD